MRISAVQLSSCSINPDLYFLKRGFFSCRLAEEDYCPFCSNGITTNEDIAVSSDGETCGSVFEASKTMERASNKCQQKLYLERTCCPDDAPHKLKSCPFCDNGFSFANASLPIPGNKDFYGVGTCEDYLYVAQHLIDDTDACKKGHQLESICCPEGHIATIKD